MTYTDPRAIAAIVQALNKALPDSTVNPDYVADLIAMTLRGDGFGIECYPDIIAKRQAVLAQHDIDTNGYPKGALPVIDAAVRDHVHDAQRLKRHHTAGEMVHSYLLSSGYRIVANIPITVVGE